MELKKLTSALTLACLLLLSALSTLPVMSLRLESPSSKEPEPNFFGLRTLELKPPPYSLSVTTLSAEDPPTNPYPLNDELTESTHWEPGTPPWIIVYYPSAGDWQDLKNNYIDLAPGGPIGNYSILDRADAAHHCLAFYFGGFPWGMDLIRCHYVKYYQALGSYGHSGRCSFGFFSFDEQGNTYWATLDYNLSTDGIFYRQCLDVWQHGNWVIDVGFDFHQVAGFVLASEITAQGGAMVIDGPKLYFDFNDPLPINQVIDEAMGISQVINPADPYNQSRIKMIAQLWHGDIEQALNCERWLLKIYVEDFYYLQHPGSPWGHPAFIRINVRLPLQAVEDPPCHYPQAGYVGSSRVSLGLSYGGIGFSIASPEKYISYSRYPQNGLLNIEWNVEPSRFLGSVSGCVFFDYCEFAIGFRTDIGYKPYAFVSGEVVIYGPAMPAEWWPDWTKQQKDYIKWLYVDPPGSEPVEPGTPSAIPPTPTTIRLVGINTMQLNGTVTELQRDDYTGWTSPSYLFCLNYTWELPETTKRCVDVGVYDSEGKMVCYSGWLIWMMYSGHYLLRGNICEGASIYVPQYAALGPAKIVVRILHDWPEIDNRECARIEMNITIKA